MKLPKLIKTYQQLRKILRKGACPAASWEGEGPCPEFIKTAATELILDDERYIVFMSLSDVKAFRRTMEEQDKARQK